MSKNYFEIVYQGPYKGINTALPEDIIPIDSSPFMENFILKDGEIRTRPVQNTVLVPGTPDGNPILTLQYFTDQNNVIHTVAITSTGLWQLNRNWQKGTKSSYKTWNLVGSFLSQPGPNNPASTATFINKFFWTNGGAHLWMWDGIGSIGAPRIWSPSSSFLQGDVIVDSSGNLQVANNSGISKSGAHPTWGNTLGAQTTDGTITWTENGKYIRSNAFVDACVVDATNGVTAGGFFLIELNAQLLLLNTIESNGGNFTQRIRWCPSGLPTIWDPNVNIGAGFNDELDVPDIITGGFSVGTTGFILRSNGITEVTSNGSAQNPFNFNHLWASQKGIGNILPFGYASYGPLGIFISVDDIYSVALSGFKRIAGNSKNRIFRDINAATRVPVGSMVPYYSSNYIYNQYTLAIPIGNDTIIWRYSVEDDSWQRDVKHGVNYTAQTNWVFIN